MNRRRAIVIVGIVVAFLILVAVAKAAGVGTPTKQKLNRDNVYYEIDNDAGDHGNYIETYHLPDGKGGKVYCIVYSDKIGDGGGAGISCNWKNQGGDGG